MSSEPNWIKKVWDALSPNVKRLAALAYEALDDTLNIILTEQQLAMRTSTKDVDTDIDDLRNAIRFLEEASLVNVHKGGVVLRPDEMDADTAFYDNFEDRLAVEFQTEEPNSKKKRIAERVAYHLELAYEYLLREDDFDEELVEQMTDGLHALKKLCEKLDSDEPFVKEGGKEVIDVDAADPKSMMTEASYSMLRPNFMTAVKIVTEPVDIDKPEMINLRSIVLAKRSQHSVLVDTKKRTSRTGDEEDPPKDKDEDEESPLKRPASETRAPSEEELPQPGSWMPSSQPRSPPTTPAHEPEWHQSEPVK
jgi:hypothetical protein